MQTKKETSSNLIKYVAGGLGFLAFGAGTYYLIRKLKEKRLREKTVRILKELRREMYPVLKTVAYKSNVIMDRERQSLPVQELKERVLKNGNHNTFLLSNCIQSLSVY